MMKRREVLATVAVASAGLSIREGTAANRDRPNILFIMTDQQHSGMMSCIGNKCLKTPAMDRLAAEGIRFERAYSSNPVCVPSRIAMATGTDAVAQT